MLRRELILGDVLVLFIIWTFASRPTFFGGGSSSPPGYLWLGLGAALFGLGWMHAVAWQARDRSISMGRLPKPGWFATRGMLRLADASVIAVVVLLLTPGDPSWGAEPSIAGLPSRIALLLLALPVALIGATWMHRIAREGSEPEAFDQHWWSRA
jgi:hypothetical protein